MGPAVPGAGVGLVGSGRRLRHARPFVLPRPFQMPREKEEEKHLLQAEWSLLPRVQAVTARSKYAMLYDDLSVTFLFFDLFSFAKRGRSFKFDSA